MSYNIINYNFDLNNFKNTNQLQAKDLHTNLFNRNNKNNVNNQNQNSNKTANNFSYNFIEQKQFNNKKKIIFIIPIIQIFNHKETKSHIN